ncbi:Glutathione synthase/Ribosomal protein S6 modification enzyme (glutaminyl transferase) [Sphingopyxis sp. LC81]|uniref:hypothetical protein n=1 Tax=unclassified Sphingopyxis TaxID=2614943 RepID=UPI00050DCC43|nr:MULTISPECIES: hypothetical protein [unclassified Sphingopyxis]KGB53346.1 Glutathione synthase/Ribosomal protein S6 modification enzyme (glutaminyl transferase) [Sphingopyxis sp. LC81]MDT7531263.1 hypothetical protein [Sphingopyxis sp. SE2]
MNMIDDVADQLNQGCFCTTLNRARLEAAFVREVEDPALLELLREGRPHLFSNISVFIHNDSFAEMARAVRTIEAVVKLPEYTKRVLDWAPAIARIDHGPAGAFMGYDFHVGADGPKLIEINTNAGGAFLSAVLARAQSACCGTSPSSRPGFPDDFERAVVGMFEQEWRLQGKSGRPSRIAIVDDRPDEQYLYPDFVLAKRLLERNGFEVVIADPEDLTYRAGQLICDGVPIDLVYNRVVDFSFAESGHRALREAFERGEVVFTPNPHVHARLADKRNLTLLSNPEELRAFGLSECDIQFLTDVIPSTMSVTTKNASELWAARRDFFFKPARGHGSKAAYRGAKLTKRVWAEIVEGTYVAQRFAPPSERMVSIDNAAEPRKIDVRLYTYRGEVLLTAARLYKGQTTNFRTEGGGFAPVLRTSMLEQCPD